MAHNTRRATNNIRGIGTRRNPPISNNFTSGGQLASNKAGQTPQMKQTTSATNNTIIQTTTTTVTTPLPANKQAQMPQQQKPQQQQQPKPQQQQQQPKPLMQQPKPLMQQPKPLMQQPKPLMQQSKPKPQQLQQKTLQQQQKPLQQQQKPLQQQLKKSPQQQQQKSPQQQQQTPPQPQQQQQQQTPPQQQQQQQQPPPQQQQQQPPPPQQQQQQPPPQQQQQQQQPPPPQQQQQQQQQQPSPQQQQQQQQEQQNPVASNEVTNLIPQLTEQIPQLFQIQKTEVVEEMIVESVQEDDGKLKKKRVFFNRGKISKKERTRRIHNRLEKTLRPKNAVMILNEVTQSPCYNIVDIVGPTTTYQATVVCDNTEHVGFGKSKMEAKNQAAESALKHLAKNHQVTAINQDNNNDNNTNDVKMETTEEVPNRVPWQYLASFALYKLLNSWGEENINQSLIGNTCNIINNQSEEMTIDPTIPQPLQSAKPAKKMPENPEQINPLMLMNQMLPQIQMEEISKSGVPPNTLFTFKCLVDNQEFFGSGTNKKLARKMCAFQVCNRILGVNYPTEIWEPTTEPMQQQNV